MDKRERGREGRRYNASANFIFRVWWGARKSRDGVMKFWSDEVLVKGKKNGKRVRRL